MNARAWFLLIAAILLGSALQSLRPGFALRGYLAILTPGEFAAWFQAVGSVGAILAALWIADRAYRRSEHILEDTRRRRQLGARAILALDLSHIVGYAKDCAAAAMRGDEMSRTDAPREIVPCPVLAPDILLRLQHLVELLDGEDADQVVDLMHCHQVQYARLSGTLTSLNHPESSPSREQILHRNNFEFTLQATVELHLRADFMFEFARRKQDFITQPPFPEDRVHNTLRVLDLTEWLEKFEYDDIVNLMAKLTPLGRWRGD